MCNLFAEFRLNLVTNCLPQSQFPRLHNTVGFTGSSKNSKSNGNSITLPAMVQFRRKVTKHLHHKERRQLSPWAAVHCVSPPAASSRGGWWSPRLCFETLPVSATKTSGWVVGLRFPFVLTDKNKLHHTPHWQGKNWATFDLKMTLNIILAYLKMCFISLKHFCHWDYRITWVMNFMYYLCATGRTSLSPLLFGFPQRWYFSVGHKSWFPRVPRNSSDKNNPCWV